jgi:hypothetical protein
MGNATTGWGAVVAVKTGRAVLVLCGPANVAMMRAPDIGKLHDPARPRPLNRPPVGPCSLIVRDAWAGISGGAEPALSGRDGARSA